MVLWGWADTGFEVLDSGPNEGTWDLLMPAYSDRRGPISLRVLAGVFPWRSSARWALTAKVPSVWGSRDALSSPTPKDALIARPIEPAF